MFRFASVLVLGVMMSPLHGSESEYRVVMTTAPHAKLLHSEHWVHGLGGGLVPSLERIPITALDRTRFPATEAGRSLAIQRIPHREAGRQRRSGPRRHLGGLVATPGAELSRSGGVP